MQYGAILNYVYNAWTHSVFFAILEKIWRPFKRAYDDLALVKWLRRGDRIQAVYEASLFARIIRFILDLIEKILSAIAGFFAPAWEGSLIARLCRGSFILNFEFLLGAFICLMFVMPHESWNNAYAVIAADISDEKRLVKLLAFIYAAVILTSLYAIIQRKFGLVYVSASFTDLKLNTGIPSRVTSTLDNPNNFSEFLVLFMPLCAAFAGTRKKQLSCVLLLLGLAFPAVALIMTYSRSGWISLMLAAFVYIWLRNKKLIPLFIALALLALPRLPSTIITRLTSIVTSFLGSSGHIDSSAQHRFALWQGVEYMIRDYGVSGIGLGPAAFASLYPLYAQPLAIDGAAHTQSLYLELILETGILGFVSFMWLALRSIKNSVIARRGSSTLTKTVLIACAASFIGIAFSCIVEYIWFYPRDLFAYFILLGVSYAAISMAEKEKHTI